MERPQGHRPGSAGYRRITVALFLGGLATFATIYTTQPLLPELARAFGLSPARSALSVSATTLSLGASMLAVGPSSETLGRTRVMHASLLASSLVTVATALAPGWHLLLALRVLLGVAVAGLPGVAVAYLREEVDPSAASRAAGLYIGGTALGGMAGRFVTGGIADLAGWRRAIAAVGLMSLGCAVAVRVLLPPSRRFTPAPLPLGELLAMTRRMATDPALLALYGIAFCSMGFCSMGAFMSAFNAMGFRLAPGSWSWSRWWSSGPGSRSPWRHRCGWWSSGCRWCRWASSPRTGWRRGGWPSGRCGWAVGRRRPPRSTCSRTTWGRRCAGRSPGWRGARAAGPGGGVDGWSGARGAGARAVVAAGAGPGRDHRPLTSPRRTAAICRTSRERLTMIVISGHAWYMNHRLLVACTLSTLALTACGGGGSATSTSTAGGGPSSAGAGAGGKVGVVASFYPLEFAVRQIGGDHVDVTNLTKPGEEPHELELKPQDVATVSKAQLAVYEKGLQPAVDDAVKPLGDKAFDVATAANLTLKAPDEGEEHEEHGASSAGATPEEHEHEHDHGAQDPHFWLDPQRYAAVADAIAARLATADPAHKADYDKNLASFKERLTALDKDFATHLKTCTTKQLVTSHAAFGYLAERYGLTQVPISGISPRRSPTPPSSPRSRPSPRPTRSPRSMPRPWSPRPPPRPSPRRPAPRSPSSTRSRESPTPPPARTTLR